jgi:3-methyl-2-oxobutanoate hydroxymethyltransferase
MKAEGKKISMLTAYDFPTAKTLDEAGVEMLLVGDSLGMVVQGRETTVSVTIEDMIYHGEMVARAARRAMVVVDLPFPVGQVDTSHTIESAARIVKQTHCQAVKLEGGRQQADDLAGLVNAGIATIAHIGLRPQSVNALGGYRVDRDRENLVADAKAAEDAGAFAILMECVPADVAAEISATVSVPTIGIGAGAHCDGQVLVTNDLLGWNSGYVPKFVRQYADVAMQTRNAVQAFRDDVRNGQFPGDDESFA